MKVAPAMFKFIMNFAGGKSGHMLSATEAFVNTCGVNKSLGFELWDCVSQESKRKSKIPRLLAAQSKHQLHIHRRGHARPYHQAGRALRRGC